MSEERLSAIERRQDEISGRMDLFGAELRVNTAKTDEVLGVLHTFKSGMKFLGWLGVGAKWIGGLAIAVTAVWQAVQALIPHK